ncbi:MAG: TIM44-like domain-containing protein, partial [Clostridia bacterium]|nr:TIM44-like domain-containing protein [Clostridia bacterium]
MKRKFRIAAIVLCLLFALVCTNALADFGGFSGDSDYSSDWGSSGSSDWGSSWGDDDSSSSGWLFWGSSSDDYYEEGSRDLSCTAGDMMVFLIVIVVIILIIWAMRRNQPAQPVMTTVQRTDDSLLTPVDQYTELDPNFSVSQMQTKLANLYVQLQDQWCALDLTPLRPYLTDELYNQSERQLEELIRAGRTPHIQRISVLGTNVRGYFVRDGMDHMIVELNTRITTYTTDEAGNIVAGDPNKEKFMTYEWDLCRTSGLVTETEEFMHSVNCPNCGAPV